MLSGGVALNTEPVLSGGTALNTREMIQSGTLERLNILSDWTSEDVVNRVRTEVPIESPAYLTLAPVQNLRWGVTLPRGAASGHRFDLQVPLWRHSILIAWFGARRIPDFRLEASASQVVGSLVFRLRWSERDEAGLILKISPGSYLIQEKTASKFITLKRFPRSAANGFRLRADLVGNLLTVSTDGRSPQSLALPSEVPSSGGLLQVYLYDVLKGLAKAKNVDLTFIPLKQDRL